MYLISHKFKNHQIQKDTKILVIGSFNPDVPQNKADFFYSRSRNYLWQLLPKCFNIDSLKQSSISEKLSFMKKHKIDFIDLISEIGVVNNQKVNYYDICIDSQVTKWNDIVSLIKKHQKINKVCLTRKTLNGIPNMKTKILRIEKFCIANKIKFRLLTTPARFYSDSKQIEWNSFF